MSGKVYLVGAGPGDPGLLTARALELIASADVILYDRLIPSTALDGARADAELLFVGKEGGGPSVPQEQTEALMVERAQAGRSVVRLKGGDPFVFGRGGEEALALRAGGHRVRDRARRHRGGGRERLRRHPRHPPRPRARGRARHRTDARIVPRGGRRRRATARRAASEDDGTSTGAPWPRSPARSCCTWGCAGWSRSRAR